MRIAAILLLVTIVDAQTPQSRPGFEVASIKMTNARNGSGHSHEDSDPGMLRGSMTLKSYIMSAYGVRDFQVAGGPNWIDDSTYEVVAKLGNPADSLPPGLTPRQRRIAEEERLHVALQTLLADRFQLKFHHETKDMPAYVLQVGKGGFKLQPAQESDRCGTNSTGTAHSRKLTATCIGMDIFATFLARQVRLPVADETHIQGLYSFNLEWGPDDLQPSGSSEEPPPLSVALAQYLGLKLESRKAPTDIIVVDSAERPSEN